MLTTVAQSDAEYTAAIAMDGKRDGNSRYHFSNRVHLWLRCSASICLIGVKADSGGMSSPTVSPMVWLYWVITVPLTLVTFLVWAVWSERENPKSSKRLMIYRTKVPIESDSAATMRTLGLLSSEEMV